jgi:thioredoxin:protein disulfide reductase
MLYLLNIYKKKYFFAFVFFIFYALSPSIVFAANEPLPAESAFQFSASIASDNEIALHWKIAPFYHLYRQQFKFTVTSPAHVTLGHVLMPQGKPMEDKIFGRYQAYYDDITINVPILNKPQQDVILQVQYQGCADSGFCYPATTKTLTINLIKQTVRLNANDTANQTPLEKIADLLEHHNLFWIILGFMGFGILLCFTPCVLPMLPILSSIVLGQKHLTTRKAFSLALSYVLGMALSYAMAGMLAAALGETLQASLQNPWILGTFAGLFVLLALSLFGFYELQLPHSIQTRVNHLSHKQRAGTYLGSFIMGALSTLIISPCVTPPLIGALTYIGQTHNLFIGAIALFSLGIGMGLPLLLLATVGSHLIPKSGNWMNIVKDAFGVLMLGVAITLLARIIPGQITLVLWAALLILVAIQMGCFTCATNTLKRFGQGLGLLLFFYGLLLLIGAGLGNNDPLQPLKGLHLSLPSQDIEQVSEKTNRAAFKTVTTLSQTQALLAQAKTNHQPVLLDFYADWCASCQEMERYTFTDKALKEKLSGFMLIHADVTQNNKETKTLAQSYQVIAPPTLLFFDKQGRLIPQAKLVGKQDAQTLIAHINRYIFNQPT